MLILAVNVHEIKTDAIGNSLFCTGNSQDLIVHRLQSLLVLCQFSAGSTCQRVDVPIIEDSCPSVVTTEAFLIHTFLAIFLAGIYHQRILLQQGRDNKSRNTFTTIASEETAGNALLVMILQEIEHVVADIVRLLPSGGNGMG